MRCGMVLTVENTTSDRRTKQRKTGRAFCSSKCGWAARGEITADTNRRLASARMKARNPMRNPASRAKMAASLRKMGHKPPRRGGNGAPPPEAQLALFTALGPGWVMEHTVRTAPTPPHPHGGVWPRHYNIDIAHPGLMVAVEVDGSSHTPIERQRSDERKDLLLALRGWRVLRFSNGDALSRTEWCVERIRSTTSG